MKTIILICVSLALFIRVTFAQENTKITARIFEHKADSLIKIFKYDSASVYYCKAAKLFEQEQNWLLAVKNYRLTSNAFIRIAKYDSSLYYFGLLIDLVERHFKEYNRDDMFEKSDDYINLADIEEKKVKYNNQLSYCNKALELVL